MKQTLIAGAVAMTLMGSSARAADDITEIRDTLRTLMQRVDKLE